MEINDVTTSEPPYFYAGDCPKCARFIPIWYPPDSKGRASCPYCMTRVHVSKLEKVEDSDDSENFNVGVYIDQD